LLQIVRPPLVRRLLRPTIIRPFPPRLVANEKLLNTTEPVTIRTSTPIEESSTDSSLSTTLSTISSNIEKGEKKKTCCYCLPCCQSKEEQQSTRSPKISHRTIHNYPNLKLKTRTIYIIIISLFIFFLIVIILLIVLIAVRR
jgi:hypothetical protein